MKIIALSQPLSVSQNFSFACLPDSALLRNNDDFYLPNFSEHISAQAGMYVQLHKIGKHIEAQFVPRYIKDCGLAINFTAIDALHELHKNSLPGDIARGFDHSFAVSSSTAAFGEHEQVKLQFEYNAKILLNTETSLLLEPLCQAIAKASEYFTYKIGDVFFVPLISSVTVHAGDVFSGSMNGEHCLNCAVR
ncbi:MAG: fumarylacetoacetate hydrolase family protein [Bacteroidales bacterium]|jgi:2-keto-4-pentenoate hydratase/2-oxohepta-3-ene-1,7-dioic acid hydratase in catechol pathway|nr:fumarylacetoacetate hydrolase family protein [Bacteroidales bacterium]